MIKALPKIYIGKMEYYIDEKLSQIREVGNPHNYEFISQELIYFWLAHNIKKI